MDIKKNAAGRAGPAMEEHVVPVNAELSDSTFRPYDDFVKRVSNLSPSGGLRPKGVSARCWFETRFRHMGVSFYGLNTCQPTNESCWPDRTVNPEELAFIGNSLRQSLRDSKGPNVIVGLGHHSPMGGVEDRSVRNPEAFRTFFSSDIKTSIFLHGHVHEREIELVSRSGQFRLIRSCASTLAKPEKNRPRDTLRGFSLLT
jgi:hypothetical protein